MNQVTALDDAFTYSIVETTDGLYTLSSQDGKAIIFDPDINSGGSATEKDNLP